MRKINHANYNQGSSQEVGGGQWQEIIRGQGDQTDRSVSSHREDGGAAAHSCELWKVIPVYQSYNTDSKLTSTKKFASFVAWQKFDQKFAGNICFIMGTSLH